MEEVERWNDKDLSHFRHTTGEDLFDVHHHFARWTAEARPGGYELYLQSLSSGPTPRVQLREGADDLINLASYNYLGLSYRPEVIAAAQDALARYGLGAAGSPHLSGLLAAHDAFASEIAAFKGTEDALLFPSGYAANVGTISALVSPGDTVITDILAHASILDGAVLAQAKITMFRHNDMDSLASRLSRAEGRKLVIVEGVYSMDGDIAPLDQVVRLCKQYGARLMVDEAHSAFVYGKQGRGLAEHFGVEDQVDVHFGTLSKSLGGIGGYVTGSHTMIDYVRTYARSLVFSCALAPPMIGGLRESLRIVGREPELRTRLWENVAIMREALVSRGVDIGRSSSQVIPILVRNDNQIFPITRDLEARGVYLNPIVYPAVKRMQSRFRVSVSASHNAADLVTAAEIIARVLRDHGVLA